MKMSGLLLWSLSILDIELYIIINHMCKGPLGSAFVDCVTLLRVFCVGLSCLTCFDQVYKLTI